MEKNIKNILFINFGGLGDEILFLPAIQSVKAKYPKAKITLALEPRSKGICDLTDCIDEVLFADIKGENKYKELFALLFRIWGKSFDVVISSGSNKFIAPFLAATMIPERIGYNSGKMSEFFLTQQVELNKNQYAVNMYRDLVRGITDVKKDLPEFVIKKRQSEPNTVLIHPGVSLLSVKKNMIKTIPAQSWAKVVLKLADAGKKVLVAGGPDDKKVIETIQKSVPSDKYTYVRTKNLKELAELIAGAEKFLCSDSAPLHIAVGLKVRTYVIFGSTDERKLIPQNGLVTPIKSKTTCPLQPCLWEKRQTTCETLDCLKISSDEVVAAVLQN